jgi:putative spermidine/putrescine transport system permease protein
VVALPSPAGESRVAQGPHLVYPAAARPDRWRRLGRFLGRVGPLPLFFLFAALVLIAPALKLLAGSFADAPDNVFGNYLQVLQTGLYQRALGNSLRLALTSALISATAGALLSFAVFRLTSPFAGLLVVTLANVGANFGGVPLAFSFIALLGTQGMLTLFFRSTLGAAPTFELASLDGFNLIYPYFLTPLMILIFLPALSAVRRDWQEAAALLGASSFAFWRRVGLPVLFPSLLGGFVLVFAQALGTYATAFALGAGNVNLLTIQIGFQIEEASFTPRLADTLSIVMIGLTGACVLLYRWLLGRAARWRA